MLHFCSFQTLHDQVPELCQTVTPSKLSHHVTSEVSEVAQAEQKRPLQTAPGLQHLQSNRPGLLLSGSKLQILIAWSQTGETPIQRKLGSGCGL